MAEDQRPSRSPVSDHTTIEGGNSDDNVITEIRDSETVSVEYVKIHYSQSASSETMVTLYDSSEDEGTFGSGGGFDAFLLAPGDDVIVEDGTYDDIYNGVIASADGNNDGTLVVTVGGHKITG